MVKLIRLKQTQATSQDSIDNYFQQPIMIKPYSRIALGSYYLLYDAPVADIFEPLIQLVNIPLESYDGSSSQRGNILGSLNEHLVAATAGFGTKSRTVIVPLDIGNAATMNMNRFIIQVSDSVNGTRVMLDTGSVVELLIYEKDESVQ